MDIHTLPRYIAARDAISILETIDVATGVRSVLREFDYVIEAPIGRAMVAFWSTTAADASTPMNSPPVR
ncbi:MAG: hypothetical protein KatS3mg048_2291 [Caldilinea sp.]|nr:hypothetical protein [Caldilinea sp.]GIV69429.1 MAG: hypothetical protein KatS3mg048_2291 [Caldilinea sp.]